MIRIGKRVAVFASIALCLALLSCGGMGNIMSPPAAGTTPDPSGAWSFAVMGDTQWTVADLDGKNPNTVAVDIVGQLTRQFVAKGVKFVIQVGDLTDDGSLEGIDTRAVWTQGLYNAGIGFFPFRGNHEATRAAAAEFLKVFPQTRSGAMNATLDYEALSTSVGFDASARPEARSGPVFTVGSNFTSPETPAGLAGLSYAFDYRNVRFVLLDQFTRTDGTGKTDAEVNDTNIADQHVWIASTLAARPQGSHAFVFAHKGLITENHVDSLFGADPSINPERQNAFVASLQGAGAGYFFCGHDHIHQRSVIVSPDGASAVRQVIAASDSSKFYIPKKPSNDAVYNNAGARETSIAQELYKIGFYIVTVEGSRVTVDYYSADNTGAALSPDGKEYLIHATPALDFTWKETFGYDLNGKEFLIAPGGKYEVVSDAGPSGTTARVLSGVNGGRATEGSGRRLTKAVSTGWQTAAGGVQSDIVTMRGMAQSLGSGLTDTYTISIGYGASGHDAAAADGHFGIVARDKAGNWVNAVDRNYGGAKKFVPGPWTPACRLGSYGVDTKSGTAWAVINYNGDFAAGKF
jgi:hypothetical protein